jgi:hypothetical protein
MESTPRRHFMKFVLPAFVRFLVGRVSFRPFERRRCEMTGTGNLAGLFVREVFPVSMASPTSNFPSIAHASAPMFEPVIVGTFGKAA